MSIDNCNTLYVTLHLASKTYSDETWCRSSCRRRYGHCSWCPWCWCAVGDDGCLEVVVAMFLLTCSSIQHMTHIWDLIINKISVASATNFRADCYLGQRLVPICGNDIMHCLYRAQSSALDLTSMGVGSKSTLRYYYYYFWFLFDRPTSVDLHQIGLGSLQVWMG